MTSGILPDRLPTGEFKTERDPTLIEKARIAFVTRAERPTQESLAQEFTIPLGTIARTAAQEGWTALRAAHLEKIAGQSDALGILLQASEGVSRPLMQTFTAVALETLQGIARVVGDINHEKAAVSSRASILNTCSFALKNVADACRVIGVVGLPKQLSDLGKEANGRWNPEMLQQINVTVQNMTDKAKAEPTPAEPAAPEFSE